jgi:cardiolipin synthase
MTPDSDRLVRRAPRVHETPLAPAPPPARPHTVGVAASLFTIANQLTLLRMLLIPAFVLLVVYGQLGWALIIFGVAGLTDALDGLIARLTGQKSALGAWLDPAADKLLLVTTFVVLTLPNIPLVNHLPIWLTVVMISRDVGIVLTVAIVNLASGPRTFRPSQLGKAATAWFIVTCVIVMLYNWLGQASPVVDFFIWTSLAITLLSGIDYLWRIGRSLR